MKLPNNSLVAVVDGTKFLVLRNTGQPLDPKLSHEASPNLSADNFSAGARDHDDQGPNKGGTDLNELAHGAAAAEWLNGKAKTNAFDDVLIIADPKTLGEMRHHYHGELKSRLVGEIDKTLTGEPLDQIAKIIASS